MIRLSSQDIIDQHTARPSPQLYHKVRDVQKFDYSASRMSEADDDANSNMSHSAASEQSHISQRSQISVIMLKLQHGKKTIGQKLQKTKSKGKS